ncbi:MAG: SGNH/GDSL hydrolase family protein, partial [Planctomycetota bacterium]
MRRAHRSTGGARSRSATRTTRRAWGWRGCSSATIRTPPRRSTCSRRRRSRVGTIPSSRPSCRWRGCTSARASSTTRCARASGGSRTSRAICRRSSRSRTGTRARGARARRACTSRRPTRSIRSCTRCTRAGATRSWWSASSSARCASTRPRCSCRRNSTPTCGGRSAMPGARGCSTSRRVYSSRCSGRWKRSRPRAPRSRSTRDSSARSRSSSAAARTRAAPPAGCAERRMGARANAVGSARIARVLQRGGLALFALLLAVLLVEGGHSLFTGRSLVDRLLLPAPVASAPFDRVAAGALTPGPYALDPDPEVLLRVKPSSRHAFAGVPASTDEFGQRPTIGTPASADRRVVLLGDSVAFGYGVSDEHTHAAQLSRWLAGACPDAASRVSVATLACPGWNAQSAFRALRDHRGRLDPHVVLYIAVANDLDDPKGVDELGWHDIDFEPDPERTACSDERHMRLMQALQGVPSRATLLDIVAGGGLRGLEHALRSGVTPESRRRWDRHVQEIARLHAELATRGAEFAVVLPFDDDYYRQLELRLAAAAPQV